VNRAISDLAARVAEVHEDRLRRAADARVRLDEHPVGAQRLRPIDLGEPHGRARERALEVVRVFAYRLLFGCDSVDECFHLFLVISACTAFQRSPSAAGSSGQP
jgi:hypothetical protein